MEDSLVFVFWPNIGHISATREKREFLAHNATYLLKRKLITMGLLLPVAWIWAYTNPAAALRGTARSEVSTEGGAQE